MNEAQARARLSDLVAAAVFPVLDSDTLDYLLEDARRVDSNGVLHDDHDEWTAGAYEVGDLLEPTVRNGYAYRVTVAGVAVTEPEWPTTGTVSQDGVTYERALDVYGWSPTFDLYRAAAAGWRIKAGKVSDKTNFGSNQGNYSVDQLFQHALEMVKHYESKQVVVAQVQSGRWDRTGYLPGAHLETST